MANIGKIGTSLKENLLYKPANWIGNTKFVKNTLGRKYQLNDDNIITAVGVGSVVAKDGIGCVLYTYQSLHNESIPEDKRPFVAALDLTDLQNSKINYLQKLSANTSTEAPQKVISPYFQKQKNLKASAVMSSTLHLKNIKVPLQVHSLKLQVWHSQQSLQNV